MMKAYKYDGIPVRVLLYVLRVDILEQIVKRKQLPKSLWVCYCQAHKEFTMIYKKMVEILDSRWSFGLVHLAAKFSIEVSAVCWF